MDPASELRRLFEEALLLLEVRGVRHGSTRELANGIQAELIAPSGGVCRCNFYYSSRKGFSVIPSGGDPEATGLVMEIMTGSSPTDPDLSRIGSDEAGKGDYMGPLTVGAVYAARGMSRELRDLGAVDSKKLGNVRLRGIAERIRTRFPGCFHVVSVMPDEYNRRMETLKESGKNSLYLLAQCHAEAVSELLSRGLEPDLVVIDRFCAPSRMEPLLPHGSYRLEMPVGGESDPVVAAASILARDAYLAGLDELGSRWGGRTAAGAGAPTDRVAAALVEAHGPAVLRQVAKLHFRNTLKILGADT